MIEVDGEYHTNEEKYALDLARDKELQNYNLTVLRFTEQEVRRDMVNVLRAIGKYIIDYQGEQNL